MGEKDCYRRVGRAVDEKVLFHGEACVYCRDGRYAKNSFRRKAALTGIFLFRRGLIRMGRGKGGQRGTSLGNGHRACAVRQIDVPAPGIVDLRHEAEIGHTRPVTMAEGAGCRVIEQAFEGGETFADELAHPGARAPPPDRSPAA